MATLAIAGVGAAVGWGVGGTALAMSIGWSVGSALGSYLFAPDGPDVEGPRLNDLDVQSAAFGRPKPRTWGTMRQAGQVIAADRIKETKHTESSGGKGGGGGGTQTTYTYSITMAVAFGEGPIDGIRRIWANGNLIWTQAADASASDLMGSYAGISIYTGSEDQNPDPTLQILHGAGNVPAYRGTAYVVFQDLELEDFGNSVPHLEAEVVQVGEDSPPRVALDARHDFETFASNGNFRPRPYFIGSDFVRFYFPEWGPNDGGERRRWRVFDVFYNGQSHELPSIHVTPSNGDRPPELFTDDPDLYPMRTSDLFAGWGPDSGIMDPYNGLVQKVGSDTAVVDVISRRLWLPSTYVQYDTDNPDETPRCLALDGRGTVWVMNNVQILEYEANTGAFLRALDHVLDGQSGRPSVGQESRAYYEDGFIWFLPKIDGSGDIWRCRESDLQFERFATLPGWPRGSSNGSFRVIGNTLVRASSQLLNGFLAVQVVPLVGLDGQGESLATILLDVTQSCGLQSSDIDVVDVGPVIVPGYSRTKSMTGRRAIEPLQQVYRFDAVESDWTLRFVPRGQEPVAEIPHSDLAAHRYGQDRPEAIGQTRTQEAELPREVVLRYLDVTANYEENAQRSQRIITGSEHKESIDVPVAESPDWIAQSAEILLYTAWLERTKHRVLLPPAYEYLDPADVVMTTEPDGTTHQLRISRVRNGSILELEGISESPSVYTSAATGSSMEVDSSVIGQRGPTRAALLDIPLLRDADNDPGFYVVANGFLPGWTGSVLYVSSDGGETYGSVLPVLTGSPMGTVTNALGAGPVSVIDRANTVNVQLPLAELESITEAALMDGRRNACAIGSPATGWELLQFRDAALEADGSYTLSHLVRGRRGTEWRTATHASGEQFVLLAPQALERAPSSVDNIGANRLYKAVTTGRPLVGAAEIEFANHAVGLKPYAPAHLKAQPQGSGDYSVSWVRRTRLGGEWRDNVGAPLGEASELYRVRVLDGATEISSTETSNTSTTVAASPGNTIAVAQISETVGPGYEAEITV